MIVDEEETEIVDEEDEESDDTEYVSEGGEASQAILGDADAAAERTEPSVTDAADTVLPAEESESESESAAAALPETASAGSDDRIPQQPAEQIERPERALQPEGVADACREEIAAQSEAAAEVVQDVAAVRSEAAAERVGELPADSDIAPQQ